MKLKEKTPKIFRCAPFPGCPAVFETDRKSFVIIGSKFAKSHVIRHLRGRIAKNEVAIEIPKDLLKSIL